MRRFGPLRWFNARRFSSCARETRRQHFHTSLLHLASGEETTAFADALAFAAKARSLPLGSKVHAQIFRSGFSRDIFTQNCLLVMYSKCEALESAIKLFEEMPREISKCFWAVCCPDLACWNAMVEGYIMNDCGHDAFRVVSLMHSEGLVGDDFTFMGLIKGCSNSSYSNYGKQIHGAVIRHQMESSTMVMNSLIGMYSRMGMKDPAAKVFIRTKQKDAVSWNIMMTDFAQEDKDREFVDSFRRMLSTGTNPTEVTFSVAFRLCSTEHGVTVGLQFFSFAQKLGLVDDALVTNSLIDMFCKWGRTEDACFVLSELPSKDVVSWNLMILGYISNSCCTEAVQLFRALCRCGVKPDESTYSNVLSSCNGGVQFKRVGEQIHACVTKAGFSSSCYVGSSLINAYASSAMVGNSFKSFQEIRAPDLVSWSAMISALSKQGFSLEALSLLNSLGEAGEKPDDFAICSALNACAKISAFTPSKCIHSLIVKSGFEEHHWIGSALVDAYAKCGDIDSSRALFTGFQGDYDSVLFNTMITAYAYHGLVADAINLFDKMKSSGLEPSQATFSAVISACRHSGLVEEGRRFFNSMISRYGIIPSMDNYACLVDLHARKGYLQEAQEVILSMAVEPTPAIYRSLLSGCRVHGNRELGVWAAKRMIQLEPGNGAAQALLHGLYAEGGDWAVAGRADGEGVEPGT
ncbi:unnamed protein product [Spirodela intermedia]|uniref:Uncharacterized protein n=1 Tax=Spirodela intermedia TaxID=51605 RepID=A0A7I8JGJ7_SPIIN|nr:unnamed protein product [Spirodela intermedia]CAA6669279.1 unnamed protein product [Spirodela intermedia]